VSFGGGFTAAAARVVLGVESSQFTAGLTAAEQQFARSMASMGGVQGEMAERSVRARVAEERYTAALKKFGAQSLQTRAALATLVGETRKLSDVQHAGAASMGRLQRGMVAGTASGIGFGRAMAFASNAFLGGAGFVYAIHSAIDASQKFQGEMALIHTQALSTTGEVKRMSAEVLKLSPKLAMGPIELSKALYRIESAGIRGAAAIKTLVTASQGARIGHADLEKTTQALIAARKSHIQLSRGAKFDLKEAMATIDAIVGSGDLRLEDLTKALQSGVIAAAQQFGVSFKEMGSALASLTVQGQPAELTATRLRYTLALLAAQTPKATKELEKIGLSSTEVGYTMRTKGLIPALELLQQHLKSSGLSIEQQNQILVRAFGGGRSSTTILALIQHLGLLRERYAQINREATPERFAQRVAYQKQLAEFQFQKLKSIAQVVKIRAGSALLPDVVKSAKGIADWLDKGENQKRLINDIKEAMHQAEHAAVAFGHGLGQLHDVMHALDGVLGGTGKTLKTLIEFMLIRKALGFARYWTDEVIRPLQKTPAAAQDAETAMAEMEAATARSLGYRTPRGPAYMSDTVSGGSTGMYPGVPAWRQSEYEASAAIGSFLTGAQGAATKQIALEQRLARETQRAAKVRGDAAVQAADVITQAEDRVVVAKQASRGVHPDRTDISILNEQTSAIDAQTSALELNAAARKAAFVPFEGMLPGYPLAQQYAAGGGKLTPSAIARALNVTPQEGAALLGQLNKQGVIVRNPQAGQTIGKYTSRDVMAHYGEEHITQAQARAIASKANEMFGTTAAPFLLASGAAAAAIPDSYFTDRRSARSSTLSSYVARAKREQASQGRERIVRRRPDGSIVTYRKPPRDTSQFPAQPEGEGADRIGPGPIYGNVLGDTGRAGISPAAMTYKQQLARARQIMKETGSATAETLMRNLQIGQRGIKNPKPIMISRTAAERLIGELTQSGWIAQQGKAIRTFEPQPEPKPYATRRAERLKPRTVTTTEQRVPSAGGFATVAPYPHATPPSEFEQNWRHSPQQLAALRSYADAEAKGTAAAEQHTKAQQIAARADEKRGIAAASTASALNAQVQADEKATRAARAKAEVQRSKALDVIAQNPLLTPTEALRQNRKKLGLTTAQADALRKDLYASGALLGPGNGRRYSIAPRPTTRSLQTQASKYAAQAAQGQAVADERAAKAAKDRAAADYMSTRATKEKAQVDRQGAAAADVRAKSEQNVAATVTTSAKAETQAAATVTKAQAEETAAVEASTGGMTAWQKAATAKAGVQKKTTDTSKLSAWQISATAKAEKDAVVAADQLTRSNFKQMVQTEQLVRQLKEEGLTLSYVDSETKKLSADQRAGMYGPGGAPMILGPKTQGPGRFSRMGGFFTGPSGMNRALGLGMMATLFSDQPSRLLGLHGSAASGLSSILMGGGSGLMFGSMLGVNPWLAAGVGASFGLSHVIGGRRGSTRAHVGSILGGVAEGAGLGAIAGTVVPGLGTVTGAVVGGAAGAALGLFKLAHGSDNAAKALDKLSSASEKSAAGMKVAKETLFQLKTDRANAVVGVDVARKQLEEAKAQEKATRGTKAHTDAVHALNAAKAQYKAAQHQVVLLDEQAEQTQKNLVRLTRQHADAQDRLRAKFAQVANSAKGHVRSLMEIRTGISENQSKVNAYVEGMKHLADQFKNSNPKLAHAAAELAQIAQNANAIPRRRVVDVVIRLGFDPAALAAARRQTNFLNKLIGGAALNNLAGGPVAPTLGGGGPNQLVWNKGDQRWHEGGRNGPVYKNQAQAWKLWRASHVGSPSDHSVLQVSHPDKPIVPPNKSGSGTGTGGNDNRPDFHSEIPQRLVTAELAAEARGDKKGERKALLAEKRWLLKQLPNARNSKQRAEILSQVITVNNALDSLKAGGSSGSGGLSFLPDNLEDDYDEAVQSGNKKEQLKALQAEAAWLRGYLKKHPKGKLHRKGEAALSTVERRIHALQKSKTSGTSGSMLPDTLETAYLKAQRTPGTADDVKALKAEQTWLQKWLADPKHKGKEFERERLEANKLLTSIDKKLDKLVSTNNKLLAAMEKQFLSELSSFWAQFGSNVFTQQNGYKMPGANSGPMEGSTTAGGDDSGDGWAHGGHYGGGKKGHGRKGRHGGGGGAHAEGVNITVEQHFPHPPTKDGHREARMAAHAVRSAFS
jgi:hypothetical protein